MKKEELRIGNYLKFHSRFGQVMEIRFEDISLFDKNFEDGEGTYDYPYYEHPNLSGEPLTEDWFRKFGFKNDYGTNWTKSIGIDYSEGQLIISYSFSREDKAFQVSQGTGGDNCIWIYPPKPNYVHELQNLYYALTKDELVLAVTPNEVQK